MKKYFSLLLIILMSQGVHAQVMQAKQIWSTISVPQLKCWECKEKLDQYLLKEKGPNDDAGILKWTINMNNATIRILYIPDRITLDYIRTSINNAGFDADSTKADENNYKLLPPICKRTEDGGGAPKGVNCKLPPKERN
ncbi:MAG: hypothetical protein JSS67_02605 [Bacteroidetes bacterium]|nr:hypothetical protein [Bacteroidota bacterium]